MSLHMVHAARKERESMGSSQGEGTAWRLEDVHHVRLSNTQWRKNKPSAYSSVSESHLPSTAGRTVKPSPAAMPPSASAAATLADNDGNHQAPPDTERQGSDSVAGNINGDDEDEVEVEEEIEAEEDTPGYSHGNDVSNIMESNRKGRNQGYGSSIQEKCGTVPPSIRLAMGDNGGSSKFSGLPTEYLRMPKEDQGINFKLSKYPTYAVSEKGAGGRGHLCVAEIMDRAANSSSVTGNEVVPSVLVRYRSGEVVNSIPCFGEEVKGMNMQSADDRKRMASRSAASDRRTEVLSPGVDFNNDNKRPAIICDFFARGWCIKGSSCSFLHIRDNENVAGQEGGSTPADRQQVLQLDEGLRNAMRTPTVYKQYSSSRDDLRSFRDVRRESEGQNLLTDDYMKSSLINIGSSPVFRSSFLSECRSSSNGLVISSDNCQSRNQSSHISSLEELAHRSYHRLSSHSSLGLGHIPTLFSNSFPSTRISPSCHASTWIGSSSFHSSSVTSEPENLPITNLAADPLCSADYKATISSDDWEPSLPFQPSFFIIPSTSSPPSQYDPLRDSIDLLKMGDRDFKFSFSVPGLSVLNATHQQTYGDSTSTWTPVPECNGDNSTTLNRIQEDVLNNNCYTSEKYSLPSDAKTEGTSVVDIQIETFVKDENSSDASHVKGIAKKSTVDKDLDGRNQSDGSRCSKDLKVDRFIQNNEIVVEQKLDGNVQKESKPARLFRAALIDFVKEMLKPTWLEGHLSKDAHNTIVKKAVDKVLSSLQPHQIPVTMDSAKQYLSTSQPKIAKLIKGYVERYGKS